MSLITTLSNDWRRISKDIYRAPLITSESDLTKIWQSYREFEGGKFFETQCSCRPVVGLVAAAVVRPRRSRSTAAYSRQTFPWTICRFVGPYVRVSVGLSRALWKNGRSDPDAVWHHRSEGSRDEAGSEVWSTGRVLLGANLGRAINCMQWGTLRRTCATVPQPSELRFGVVRAVGRGIAVWGSTSSKGKGKFFWGVVLHFHTFYGKTWQH